MKKIIVILVFSFLFVLSAKQTFAIYDPFSVPNNKFGIHILFPSELSKAKELVNSSGGDWGYVTIPIQAGDKDLIKWQSFFDECRKLHLIPVVRLATEGDYFDTATWRKGRDSDIVDFANFLNSLNWPVKNRYVIVFNEVNRADEWEGKANPAEYAQELSYAVTVFKSKSQDFFIISAGLDNAAQTDGKTYNEYDYLYAMNQAKPGIFNQIDGFASHSYPNPAFSQPPTSRTSMSIYSFSFEKNTLSEMTNKKLPIFITETGWDQTRISPSVVGQYYKTAFQDPWNDPQIVAVTPFLLTSGAGPFQKFSFLDAGNSGNEVFRTYQSIAKIPGRPRINPVKKILGVNAVYLQLPVRSFQNISQNFRGIAIKKVFKWFLFGL
jgi:hypothetical protein